MVFDLITNVLKIDFGELKGYIFSKLIQLLGRGTHLTFYTQITMILPNYTPLSFET